MASKETPLKASILDKLIGDSFGGRRGERLGMYIPPLDRFGERELRGCIQRDLAWLLNDVSFETAVPLDDYPEIKSSVLNQGLPELVGRSLQPEELRRRSQEVVVAVRAFEQRLRPETVRVSFDRDLVETENKLRIAITGEVRNAVEESWVELVTTVDLDDGHVEVR